MNSEAFFIYFAKYAPRYRWWYYHESICGKLFTGSPWEWDCPLTVVAKEGTRRIRPFINEYLAAIKLLGLPLEEGKHIQAASDYIGRYPSIRQRLLKCCGLASLETMSK